MNICAMGIDFRKETENLIAREKDRASPNAAWGLEGEVQAWASYLSRYGVLCEKNQAEVVDLAWMAVQASASGSYLADESRNVLRDQFRQLGRGNPKLAVKKLLKMSRDSSLKMADADMLSELATPVLWEELKWSEFVGLSSPKSAFPMHLAFQATTRILQKCTPKGEGQRTMRLSIRAMARSLISKDNKNRAFVRVLLRPALKHISARNAGQPLTFEAS